VIKNPGVKPDSQFLLASKKIETDLSLFLTLSPARLFAVTGTKGKSGTASALYKILSADRKKGRAFLGGNITVSPLSFLDELSHDDDVVLELSSFQLGDIKNSKTGDGSSLLKPKAAVITSIMRDHLDRYASMEEYIDDKKNIYRGQDKSCVTVAGDDEWGISFKSETNARTLIWSGNKTGEGISGGWIDADGRGLARFYDWSNVNYKDGEIIELVPENLLVQGRHQRLNMLCAALAAAPLGVDISSIRNALSSYSGIEHRLELFHKIKTKSGNSELKFYNDSAATIPEAAVCCIEALSERDNLILVTGGTDKNLDFSSLANAAVKARKIILLAGTGSEKLALLLAQNGVSYNGPFNNIDEAVKCAAETAEKQKQSCNVALSPGCASFGMFLNEFDRGRKWKEAVLRLTK